MAQRRYTSQSLTAGTLWLAGDILSQRLTWPGETVPLVVAADGNADTDKPVETVSTTTKPFGLSTIDWHRAAIMTSFGLFIAGPLYTFWYRLLDEKMVHLVAKWVSVIFNWCWTRFVFA